MTIINTIKTIARTTINNTEDTLSGQAAIDFMQQMDALTQPSSTPVLTGTDATSFMEEMDALTCGTTQRNTQAEIDDSWSK